MERISIIGLLMLGILLSGCSSAPKIKTGEAVYYALNTDSQLRVWAERCGAISNSAKALAWSTHRSWWQRNGSFVEGADYGLTRDIMMVSGDRDVTGADLAMGFTAQIVADAQGRVDAMLSEVSDQETLCGNILSKYEKGDFDLRGDDDLYPTLVDLQRRSQAGAEALKRKQQALIKKKKRRFGRSLYTVEKIARRSGCPAADVTLIKNAWPHEVYDLQCPGGDYVLVRCEWGNCLIND